MILSKRIMRNLVSAFGLMPTLAQSNYYRPQNVSRDYKDLYFAGAS